MKTHLAWMGALVICGLCSGLLAAQQADSSAGAPASNSPGLSQTVPRVIRFSGMFTDPAGKPLTGPVDLHFSIYREQNDAAPVWQETQTLNLDEQGHYTVLLGAMQPEGLPLDLFTSGEARWLGVSAGTLPEQSRTLLVSVPYALKAGDAETLGGKPASAFMLAQPTESPILVGAATGGTTTPGATAEASELATRTNGAAPLTVGGSSAGTMDFVAKWVDGSNDLGNSLIYDNGTNVGIGTTSPATVVGETILNVFGINPALAFSNANQIWAFQNVTARNNNFEIADFTTPPYPSRFVITTGGAVGIGTTTPATAVGETKLNVFGTNPAIAFSNANQIWAFQNVTARNNNFEIADFTTSPYPSRFVITTGGNIGIGTTTPAYPLDVAGNIHSSGTVTASSFTGNGAGLTGIALLGANTFTTTQTITSGDLAVSSGDIDLPQTTGATVGVVNVGGTSFVHACCSSSAGNTFVGGGAGNFTNSGNGNTASGYSALNSETTGNANTATGGYALYSNTTGGGNTAVGANALWSNTGGTRNTATGFDAGFTLVSANANVTGASNTFIGAFSGPGVSGITTPINNATAIGANAVVSESNALVLGSINGVNGATSNVNVGIGTPTPAATLNLNVGGSANADTLLVGSTSRGIVLTDTGADLDLRGFGAPLWINMSTGQNTYINPGGGLVGIGTSSPAATLEVNGTAKFDGAVTFAGGQTFPGAGTITGVTAGADLTGGGSTGSVTLNLDTTKVPLLNASNIFTGNQTVNGNLGVTGAATIGGLGSFITPGPIQLVVNSGGSGTTTMGTISGNASTSSGSGGLFLVASDAPSVGNNSGLLFVGPTSGQWEQGPSSTGGPTNFMSIALNSSATAAENISFNTPTGVPVQTGRYGGSFTNTLDDGNNNMTALGWIWQKGRNYLQSNPSNPASTSNTIFTMMGLGSTLALTPKFSGTVIVRIDSEAKNTVDGNGIQFEIFYGTGTAPLNGFPTFGTQVGPTFERDFWGANATVGFGTNLKITGLTVGTTYWFDIAVRSLGSGSSNATIQNIEFHIEEI